MGRWRAAAADLGYRRRGGVSRTAAAELADAGIASVMASDGRTTMSSLELGFHSDIFFNQICFQIKLKI